MRFLIARSQVRALPGVLFRKSLRVLRHEALHHFIEQEYELKVRKA